MQSSYRLDYIGEVEVGMKKVSYEGTLNDLYDNDLQTFIDYNIRDVKILVELDKKLNFIEIARGIAHLGHIPYEDINMSSRWLEGAILVYLKKLGVVAPNKPRPAPEGEPFAKVRTTVFGDPGIMFQFALVTESSY